MRPATRDVLTAWGIGLAALVALLVATIGCVSPYPTEASETFTEVEMALVDHTARFATQLGVKARGEITDKMYPALAEMNPTAWFDGSVAYYYRPNVARYVRLVPTPGCETAANVAAHEVAHALYHAHDAQHWCCTQHMGATPTYPAPVAGLVCDAIATRCKQ